MPVLREANHKGVGVAGLSATEVLRRMLDERGVEWMDDSYAQLWCTVWDGQDGKQWRMTENRSGMLTELKAWQATPEQAIEATLGWGNAGRYVGLRQGEYWERTENSDYYCGGCGWKVTDHDSYCPECGGALHKAALGSCNCSNSERTETCRIEQTGHVKVAGVDYYDDDYECSECGAEMFEGYNYCPNCGRKVVVE